MPLSRREFLQAQLSALGALVSGACSRSPASNGSSQAPSPGAAAPAQTDSNELSLLILGGTGFLGPHVVRAATARGHTMTLFNRGKTNPHLFPDLEKLEGDRDGDLKALEGRKWDGVIDTSGYVPRLVKASAELLAPNVGQYQFVSSVSVYASLEKLGIDETAPVGKMEDETKEEVLEYYGPLKALCEQAAEAAAPGRTTNVRPGLIVGPGDPTDRFTYWPARLDRGGEVLCPSNPKDPIQFIDARDLAEWMIGAFENEHVGVYNAVGPAETYTIGELIETCNAVAGKNASLSWADLAFLEKHEVQPWTQMTVWVPPVGETAGLPRIDASRAIATGMKFRAAEEIVRDTLEWFREQPEERRAKLRAGITPEREAELLKALKKKKAA